MTAPTFTTLRGRMVVLPASDIDTDQIIPARYLKVTSKEGLGANLFADWRKQPDFPLNRPEAQGAEVLVAGANFACGSSREHAPWALLGGGFRAVVAPSFADIFRGNALKNGLLPVAIDAAAHARLIALANADPSIVVDIDLATQVLTLPDGTAAPFPVDPFAKRCLLDGVDELGYLLRFQPAVEEYERRQQT